MKRKRRPISLSTVIIVAIAAAFVGAIAVASFFFVGVSTTIDPVIIEPHTLVQATAVPDDTTVAQTVSETACKLDSYDIARDGDAFLGGVVNVIQNVGQGGGNNVAASPPQPQVQMAVPSATQAAQAQGGQSASEVRRSPSGNLYAIPAQPAQELQDADDGISYEEAESMPVSEPDRVAIDEDMIEEPIDESTGFVDYGENPTEDTEFDNLSTFAMDVDTASFSVARNYLLNYGALPPANAIRSEEFINYFATDYAQPQGNDAFAIHMDAAPSPFTEDTLLLRVGIQGRAVNAEDRDPALIIVVLDTSGSMDSQNRIGLAKDAMRILVEQLSPKDCIGIVEYSNNTRVVVPPIPVTEENTNTLMFAINSLYAGGSTYAEAGLQLGYDLALDNVQKGANTRVVLMSDGVANVGATGPDAILQTIRAGVEDGITLTSIGVGMGDFNDMLLEQLANNGNGNYYYIDDRREAQRVFATNLTSTLQVIGYDAKIQVEFNRDTVSNYRLIGYENRAIADSDFRNDSVDAGEVGAGHTVTALYEVTLTEDATTGRIATTFIRYENAETREVEEINESFVVDAAYSEFSEAPEDYRVLAIVAEFSELLHANGQGDWEALSAQLTNVLSQDEDIQTLRQMVQTAMRLAN